ncbi:MAG TPA: asparagine synthase-related protein, partial [Roseiflexaceae bacterium]|nr:asparagine synthase-related protein [Roseiflexaceae bacterium]
LPEILYWLESFDQDLVRSAIPCYFTSRLAASEVKVILTGEGADELFAGYTYHKAIVGEDALHRELRRSITTLHNINLQRVDRMTMAHSLEGRVPFLDLAVIEQGLRIPASLKLPGAGAKEKWVLRKAFEDLLPPEIVWRDKEQFDEGSGTADLTPRLFAQAMNEEEAQAYRQRFPNTRLRSAEECHYHLLLCDVFEHPEAILANVARWAARPADLPEGAAGL